jgi:solute carrier family 35 protein E1
VPKLCGGERGDTATMDVVLWLYYLAIMLMQYQYTLWGQLAANEAGGRAGGLTVTIAVSQVAVCAAYALVLWAVGYNPVTLFGFEAPARQPLPRLTATDLRSMMVLGLCYAAAHSAGHYSLTIGHFAFAQIVKAAEPVFTVVVGAALYGKRPSLSRWCCIPLIVCGVATSTLKVGADGRYAVDFDGTVLLAGSVCNVFAAFRGAEAERVMGVGGLKERLGGPRNQFAVTNVLACVLSLPIAYALERDQWGRFAALCASNEAFRFYLLMSGLFLYVYNELATLTISKTSALTASVANTAKRAFVIVGVALALGKTLRAEEKAGAALTIGATLLYSVVDTLRARPESTQKAKRA